MHIPDGIEREIHNDLRTGTGCSDRLHGWSDLLVKNAVGRDVDNGRSAIGVKGRTDFGEFLAEEWLPATHRHPGRSPA
jgi:hypothetical protein